MGKDQEESIKQGFIRIWIIWGAMFGSLFVYLAVCHFIEPQLKITIKSDFPIDSMKNALFTASLAISFLSVYVRKFILNSKNLTKFSQTASRSNINPAVFKYQTAVIISLALSESIGILGLVLFILTKDKNALYIFIAVSAVVMIYNIPKKSEIPL